MKELQLPPGKPQDEGRWCQCCTSLRLYGRINAIYYLRLMETDWWELRRSSRALSAGDNTSICQEPTAWIELCRKGPGVDTKLNKRQHCALAAKNYYISFPASGGTLPKGGGRWPFHSILLWRGLTWVLCLFLCSSVQERHGATGENHVK